MMPDRHKHQWEVRGFLQKNFSIHDWLLSLPGGSGMETYFAQSNEQNYFVKVGAPVERYLAMAEFGLTPPVLALGQLVSGLSIIVQPFIVGRKPSRKDYSDQLEKVAALINKMHHHPSLKEILKSPSSNFHKNAGLQALNQLCQMWERYKTWVPNVAESVDNSLDVLTQQVNQFSTEGLVASHNDICNANWLFTSDGQIYVVDFESMSMDDPALDMGALLWWYYPPELRQRFLDIAGYPYNDEFRFRMQVRMAMHCLSITLPREGSFDSFNPNQYSQTLNDFRAILDGKENPQGYSAR
jgi:thiamine kinase-like enzyme